MKRQGKKDERRDRSIDFKQVLKVISMTLNILKNYASQTTPGYAESA